MVPANIVDASWQSMVPGGSQKTMGDYLPLPLQSMPAGRAVVSAALPAGTLETNHGGSPPTAAAVDAKTRLTFLADCLAPLTID